MNSKHITHTCIKHRHMHTHAHAHTHHTHLRISEFREGIHDDTKHNVEANGGDNDEECDIKEEAEPSVICIANSNFLTTITQCSIGPARMGQPLCKGPIYSNGCHSLVRRWQVDV